MAVLNSNEAINPQPGLGARARAAYNQFRADWESVAGPGRMWSGMFGVDELRDLRRLEGARAIGGAAWNWLTAANLAQTGAEAATRPWYIRGSAMAARMGGVAGGLGLLAGGAYLGYRGIRRLMR